jgi:hypothetical protein
MATKFIVAAGREIIPGTFLSYANAEKYAKALASHSDSTVLTIATVVSTVRRSKEAEVIREETE